jgi:hypothetical protein
LPETSEHGIVTSKIAEKNGSANIHFLPGNGNLLFFPENHDADNGRPLISLSFSCSLMFRTRRLLGRLKPGLAVRVSEWSAMNVQSWFGMAVSSGACLVEGGMMRCAG